MMTVSRGMLLLSVIVAAQPLSAQQFPRMSESQRIEMLKHPASRPVRMVLEQIRRKGDVAAVEVRAFDAQDIPCLDARNLVCFGIVGDGRLIDNLGTSTGSRQVQLYNGRAEISIQLNGGRSIISVASEGMQTQFLRLGWDAS